MAKKKSVKPKSNKGSSKNTKKSSPKKKSSAKSKDSKKPTAATKKLKVIGESKPCFLSMEEFRTYRDEHWEELHEARESAEEVLEKYRDMIMSHPDVTGIHIGYKRVAVKTENGVEDLIANPPKMSICVHVTRKLDVSDPECAWAIPPFFNGIPTDVQASNFQKSDIENPSDTQFQPVSKIQGGIAIRRKSDGNNVFGTLGFVVKFAGIDHYLTNDHVAGPEGSEIVQPPGGSVNSVIGETRRSKKSLTVDAAIVKRKGSLSREQTILGFDADPDDFVEGEVLDMNVGDEVILIGANTNETRGIVDSVSGQVTIPGQGEFVGQILIKPLPGATSPITGGGNSGGVVLLPRSNGGYKLVGLLHASTDDGQVAVATHFRDVQRTLGITL